MYNQIMYEFHPYFTSDGSVGLYNKNFDDIYHSADGALSEAYEKFVCPIDFDSLLCNDKIKILDICFGIGYNSKSFLNYILHNFKNKKFYQKKSKIIPFPMDNIDTIHTNNIFNKISDIFKIKNKKYNDTIYTNKFFSKIFIKAIDKDKKLIFLSPFIKTGEKKSKNKNLNFNYKKIDKIINSNCRKKTKKIDKLINYLFLEKVSQKYPDFYTDKDISSILNAKEYGLYFERNLKGIFELYRNTLGKSIVKQTKLMFLHNIYYKYISNCYKKRLKYYNLQDINIQFEIDDARNSIKHDKNIYNIIFLDAFTPAKCPCLWSYDFFKELYNHLDNNGIILTYTRAASVRNAMIKAQLYIGEILDPEKTKCIGTIAAKNKNLIKHALSEYDLGLLKTKAGIFYRDENLTALNEAIIKARNLEVKTSNLISSSQYNKTHKEKEWTTI